MRSIDTATRLCAIIGNPVAHSMSPHIHNAVFEALGLNYVYLAFPVEDLAGCLAGMRAMPSFRGLSVTIPHKLAVIPLLDEVDSMAQKVGSVNTVTQEDGRLIGTTTDGAGALSALEEAGESLDGRSVLFLGSGGAVRAVAFAVADQTGAERVTLLGRTPERVQRLADDLKSKTSARIESGDITEDIESAMAQHDVIINGTPFGMHPEHEGQSCVPPKALRPEHVVFDMVYTPLTTRLLEDAETAGCKVVPGLEMLVHQAALQFAQWTGQQAPLEVMRQAALDALGQA